MLVRTPYVLLLAFPGINVASAGEFAGEMGPISHYAHARAITGRAGLYPSRYQSDQVDLCDGALVRCANPWSSPTTESTSWPRLTPDPCSFKKPAPRRAVDTMRSSHSPNFP